MEFFKEPENWVAVAFVIFVGILLYIGIQKKITDALDHRANRIKDELGVILRYPTYREGLRAIVARAPRPSQ